MRMRDMNRICRRCYHADEPLLDGPGHLIASIHLPAASYDDVPELVTSSSDDDDDDDDVPAASHDDVPDRVGVILLRR